VSAAAPAAAGGSGPWLLGPWRDYLFGYGLVYILSIPVLWLVADAPAGGWWIAPALAFVFSVPHYGATLLRVYERREDRRKYTVFAVWATLALAALFLAGLHSKWVGSLLFTVYLTWGPWHFSGQNYGLGLMHLRRSGIQPDPLLKRLVYLCFVISAGLAILYIHVSIGAYNAAALPVEPTNTFQLMRIGVPTDVLRMVATVGGGVWLACVAAVGFILLRRMPLRGVLPVASLLGMQGIWYLVPLSAGRLDPKGFAFTAIWVAIAHAVQYLWVTYYYARREGRTRSFAPFYVRAWLAGGLLLLPMLVLAPGVSSDFARNAMGVVVLGISVLNIHHFVLDGAIWKLRDGRVARVLLRQEPVTPEPIGPSRRLRLAGVVLAVGAIPLLVQGYAITMLVQSSQESDPIRLQRAAERLDWLGRTPDNLWAKVGKTFDDAGASGPALEAYRRFLERSAEPPAWILSRTAWLLLERADQDPSVLPEATLLSRRLVLALDRSRPEGLQTLAAVHARSGRWRLAARAAEAALVRARAAGDERRVKTLERQLEGYRREADEAASDASASTTQAAR